MDLQLSIFRCDGETDLQTISNSCPRCGSDNSLIIMDSKVRSSKRKNENLSLMKVQCIRCKWKIMKDFKWNIRK